MKKLERFSTSDTCPQAVTNEISIKKQDDTIFRTVLSESLIKQIFVANFFYRKSRKRTNFSLRYDPVGRIKFFAYFLSRK